MSGLLIVAGVLFLLLAIVLFIAAIVAYFMARNRSDAAVAPAPYVPQPAPAPRVAQPVSVPPAPFVPVPPVSIPAQPTPATPVQSPVQPMAGSYPLPAPVDGDKTVMTDQRRGQLFRSLHGTS